MSDVTLQVRGRGRRAKASRAKSVYGLGRDFWLGSGRNRVYLSDVENKPYLYSPWVYACARAIALNLCRLSAELYEKKSAGQSVTEHEFLSRLDRPNPLMTFSAFRQAIILNLLLPSQKSTLSSKNNTGGQCFIVPWNASRDDKVDLRSGEIPEHLYPFSDTYFSPIKEQTGPGSGRFDVTGWRFEIPQKPGSRVDFSPTEIIRLYFYNPYDWLGGAAPYIAAQIAVDQDAKADVYNSRLYENDGRVTGVLSTDQQNLTDDIADIYMQRWMENYGGVGNVGKTAILGNGLKYQQLGLTMADMQYVEQKRWNKDQIIASFGLNKIALGDYEKINYATIREGRKVLWYDTYIPIDRLVWEQINGQWTIFIEGGKYRARSDYGNVEALQDDRKAQSEAGKNLVQGMDFPPALAARISGINLKDEDIAQWPHLMEPPRKAPASGKDADGDGEVVEDVTVKRKFPSEEEEECFRWVDDYVAKVLDPGEEALFVDLRRFFYAQRNAMQDKVDEWARGQGKTVVVKSDMIDPEIFLLDPEIETRKLAKMVKPHFLAQMDREAAKIESEIGQLIDWHATDEGAAALVGQRAEDLKGINRLTFKKARKQVMDKVHQGIKENWTTGQITREIKAALGSVAGTRVNQARTIARTELGIVSSESRFQAFRAEGVEWHRWLTHRDERVRLSHRRLNNKKTRVGQAFPGTSMKFPRDSIGGPGEVINCRCVAVAFFPK